MSYERNGENHSHHCVTQRKPWGRKTSPKCYSMTRWLESIDYQSMNSKRLWELTIIIFLTLKGQSFLVGSEQDEVLKRVFAQLNQQTEKNDWNTANGAAHCKKWQVYLIEEDLWPSAQHLLLSFPAEKKIHPLFFPLIWSRINNCSDDPVFQ